jgi:dTDP-4-amino-4,6-dideoxygalactose transaminase
MHLNSGEGGFLASSDPEITASSVLYSGSCMLYEKHPDMPANELLTGRRLETPNYSGCMDNLRAASLRVQLRSLDENYRRGNELYAVIEQGCGRLREFRCRCGLCMKGLLAALFSFHCRAGANSKSHPSLRNAASAV